VESIFPTFVRIDRQSRHSKDSSKRVSESVHLSHFGLPRIPMTKQSGWKCIWASCSNHRNDSKSSDNRFAPTAGWPRRILLSRLGNIGRQRVRILTYLLISGALSAAIASAQQPTVTKVEPPSWWAGHSINPVRLLVRGTNLSGASVTAGSGFRAGHVKANAGGTYLFVDVQIPKKAAPGAYLLELKTKGGSTEIPFRIQESLSRKDHFQGFSDDDVIYLIMPDRFADGDPSNDDPAISHGLLDRSKPRFYHGGDIQGVIDHLPYLKDLGVTAIWTTPVYDNNNRLNEREVYDGQGIADYHGYGAVDYYGVEEHLGSIETLRKLVEEAHRLGIKVIQDQVENHVSPYHPWVQDAPMPDWFHGTPSAHVDGTSSQMWVLPDPNAPASMRKQVTEGWFVNLLPDMNQENPEVARYEIQNSLWWLGTVGFDGIRQDTWPYVGKSFWREWMHSIKAEYPTTSVVGEVFNGDPTVTSFFLGGRTAHDGIDDLVDSVFDFPTYFRMREAFAQGKPLMRDVANSISHDYLYSDPNRLVTFLGLHDLPRFMSEAGASVDGLKLAFTLLLTSRGIPMIYYGDEIAMPGGNDPDNRRDFPGGWKGDEKNAFTAEGRSPEQENVFAHVRKLAGLRRKTECLRRSRMLTLVAGEQVWAYARVSKQQTAVVVFNNAPDASSADINLSDLGASSLTKWNAQLGTGSGVVVSGGKVHVTLPPRSSEIYLLSSF